MTATSAAPERTFAQRSRRFGLLLVAILAVALTTTATVQILRTTLWPPDSGAQLGCREGVVSLYRATERARTQAARQIDGERAALHDFRASLEPEWSNFGAVQRACAEHADGAGQKALRSVELHRYAEERAVRYDALDLSRLRRDTPRAVEALSPH